MSAGPYLKGFENVDIARSFMWVESVPDDEPATQDLPSSTSPSSSFLDSLKAAGEYQPRGQESVVGTPEEESLLFKLQHNAAWLSSFVSQLSTWLATTSLLQATAAEPTPEEALASLFPEEEEEHGEIWQEWEWIMSETERLALRRTTAESMSIQKELEALRNTANVLKARPIFLQHAKMLLREKLNPQDAAKLAERTLDASKRSKVVADVVTAYAPDWLHFVRTHLFQGNEASFTAYQESFNETNYSKGVVGGLKETGWQASHGPGGSGLTYQVLGDITWAFWKSMNSSLRWNLNRELTAEESASLAEAIVVCQEKLIELWLATLNNSEFGAAHEGRLPAIWAEEARKEKARLNEIKRKGANARYEYKPIVTTSSQLNRQKLGELRRFLETRLQFRISDS